MASSQTNRTSRRSLFVIYAALILMLVVTAVGAFLPVGAFTHNFLAFGISVAKTVLIVLFFMELYYNKGLVRLFACIGVIWLMILFLLTFSDYLTRG